MTNEKLEEIVLQLVNYLEKRKRENTFVPLSQMKGVFAHLNFDWRNHAKHIEGGIIMLDHEAVQEALKDEDEKIVLEFHAQYFHSVMEDYEELFLDTVFYKEGSYEDPDRVLDKVVPKATNADFRCCQTNKQNGRKCGNTHDR